MALLFPPAHQAVPPLPYQAPTFMDCAWCWSQTKDASGTWVPARRALVVLRKAQASHGMCPGCAADVRAQLERRR